MDTQQERIRRLESKVRKLKRLKKPKSMFAPNKIRKDIERRINHLIAALNPFSTK